MSYRVLHSLSEQNPFLKVNDHISYMEDILMATLRGRCGHYILVL